MASVTQNSPAKINLTLRAGPLRSDGFHEIESLVARVGLYDQVGVTPRHDRRCTLTCDDPTIPSDDTNLALKAAHRLAKAADVSRCGAHIELEKRIPAGRGLGGGSSNAATVLMLLNDLWQTRLPPLELAKIGAQIGSDVPLFLHAPFCVVRGRGEIVEEPPLKLSGWVVLILPEVHCDTRAVYAAFDRSPPHAARPSVERVLQHARSAGELMPHLFNDLEAAAFTIKAGLAELSHRLHELAGGAVRLTGTGSAFFRLFDEPKESKVFAARVRDNLRIRVEVVPLER